MNHDDGVHGEGGTRSIGTSERGRNRGKTKGSKAKEGCGLCPLLGCVLDAG